MVKEMDYKQYFKGKKITVMGLGVLGRGVGDTAFLSEMGAELIVTDLKTEADLKKSLDELKGYENITYVLGEHRLEDFTDRDMILKAAGVPLDSPYIEAARAHNVPIKMSASLVAELTPATIICITGSRGKSSVTHLVYHILKEALRQSSGQAGRGVFLGGNVRGIATLPVLREAKKGDYIVMELDSWQLQGFGEAHVSPHIAVFTTFYPDHMNYYKGDMQTYFGDKAHIYKYQTKDDILITTSQVEGEIKKYDKRSIASKRIIAGPFNTDNPSLIGDHNKLNTGCAAEVARVLGIPASVIQKAIDSFPGVEGRLQFVREIDGVKIYNDNNATTPTATHVALEALDPQGKQNILLICGGTDKGLPDVKTGIREAVHKHAKRVFFLSGTGTDRVKGPEDTVYDSLREAVTAARGAAVTGDIILFSPAFASFGMFKNEYDRNDQFLDIIQKLS